MSQRQNLAKEKAAMHKAEEKIKSEGGKVKKDEDKESSSDSESDFSSSSSESSDTEDEGKEKKKKKSTLHVMQSGLRKTKKLLSRTVVNYGPPYARKQRNMGADLLDEVCGPTPSTFFVHGLLNKRCDPNYRDPDDFYWSAMHWCGRHSHLMIMRILRAAQADINLLNEMGQTPMMVRLMKRINNFMKLTF